MPWNNGRPPHYNPQIKSGPFRNPDGTVPSPYPTNLPAAQWTSPVHTLGFANVGLPAGVHWRSIWQTPLFDLRPDLGVSQGNNVSAVNTSPQLGVQPIWRASGLGAGGKLFFWINNINTAGAGMRGMRVYSIEFGHPANAYKAITSQITGDQDQTACLIPYVGQNAGILEAFPTGDGYPMRYWLLRLQFDIIDDYVGAPPTNLQVQACFY